MSQEVGFDIKDGSYKVTVTGPIPVVVGNKNGLGHLYKGMSKH